jgi:hypothetical protein
MSLINDALRRTSQSKPPVAASAETPLKAVEPQRSHANLALVLAPIIILLLGLAGWFWIKWWESSIQMSRNSNALRVAAREASHGSDLSPNTSPGDEPARGELIPRTSTPNGFLPSRPGARPGLPSELPAKAGRPGPNGAPALAEPASATLQTNLTPVPTARSQAIDPDAAMTATPIFKLQGVFYRPANPSAVINGKVVYIGDKVEQARVLAIEMEEVLIEYKGQRTVLSLQ